MIGCPNCGNKLVFDVELQRMKCRYCSATFLISEAAKWSKDAYEQTAEGTSQNEMEVTTFTCSQCGAEISADTDEAVTWCSYCGSPATLHSRLTRIRRPDLVVPFQKSKDECVAEYKRIARTQIYAPRDLIRHGDADGFRGIYMPYWTYDISRRGTYDFLGEMTEPEGDGYVKITYRIQGRLSSNYSGLSHDASQTFDDYVSERIAPYPWRNKRQFNLCYLNGFYANAADTDDTVYLSRIVNTEKELIYTDVCSKYFQYGPKETSVITDLAVQGQPGVNGNFWTPVRELKKEEKPQATTENTLIESKAEWEARQPQKAISVKSKLAMFPVWFMSYRWGDRVSYATMNGDTGKMYAEFPASPKRFLFFSALTTIPLAFFFYSLYTLTPSYILFVALMAALGASCMFKSEVMEIFKKQYHVITEEDGKKVKHTTRNTIILCLIGAVLLMPGIQLWWDTTFALSFLQIYRAVSVAICVVFVIRLMKMSSTYSGIVDVAMNRVNIWFLLTAIAAATVFFFNPASDELFYGLAFAVIIAVGISVFALIKSYNVLSSTRPKQFNRSGGEDDHA